MILGLEDISGGTAIVSFLIWLVLSALFYLVCYMAALNVLDDQTKNSWLKVPAMGAAAFPAAGLIAVFNYKPLVLFVLMAVANYFRIKKRAESGTGDPINLPLFYIASYGYLVLVLVLAYYFPTLAKSLVQG